MPDVEPIFLDTNVLVYATIAEAPFHEQARQTIESLERAGRGVWISRQVLREYLAILTRPQTYTEPVSPDALAAQIRHFEHRFQVADDNALVTAQLLQLLEQVATGGKQVHDANIVATMLVYGIPELVTVNLSDFTRFSAFIRISASITAP